MKYPLLSEALQQIEGPEEEYRLLTETLFWHAGATITGVKPAYLLHLFGDLKKLWDRHHIPWTSKWQVKFKDLHPTSRGKMILLYKPKILKRTLSLQNNQKLLKTLGYPLPIDLETCLNQLSLRFAKGIPHEIGLFLGYPAKDVAGFMGLLPLPLSFRTPWQIFAPPEPSLALAKRYETARQKSFQLLQQDFSRQ